LNNDTSVDPACFEELIRFAKSSPAAGIISPRICYYSTPERIWYDGGMLKTEGGLLTSAHINEDCSIAEVSEECREVDYICGCAMLIPRSIVETIGGLDSRFFLYWEDVDFSLRAKKAGFRLFHVPSAVVLHKVSRSVGGKKSADVRYYTTRNRYFVSAKGLAPLRLLKLLKHQVKNCLWSYLELMDDNETDQALAIAEVGWDSFVRRWGKRRGRPPSIVLKWFERQRRLSSARRVVN
jgi:GT2 family glycosyltransferase